MANIAAYMQAGMLNWCLLGATPTRPAAVYCGLSLTAPTSVAPNEVASASGYTRQSAGFAAAATPAGSGSASNSAAMTFGPFSSSAVMSGLFLIDNNTASLSTNMLWFGTLATVRTPLAGDSIIIAAGALSITLA
jgi:hypothetical protein